MQKVWTAKEVERVQLIAQGVVSLNTPVLGDDGHDMETELGDFLEDQDADVEQEFLLNERHKYIRDALRHVLSPKECEVLWKRHGFDGPEMTLEEVGKTMGITRERVRQLEARAIRKLRMYFARKRLTEVDI